MLYNTNVYKITIITVSFGVRAQCHIRKYSTVLLYGYGYEDSTVQYLNI